jgi:hypothetical protein
MLYYDFLADECYCVIARISCMLAFYKLKLDPFHENRFQNYRKLFYIGNVYDYPAVFYYLSDVEIYLKSQLEIASA